MPKTMSWTAFDLAKHRLSGVAHLALWSAALLGFMDVGQASAQAARLGPVRLVAQQSAAQPAPVTRQVELLVDFAVVLRFAGDVSVVVLGNAEIADVSIVATGTIVLTGKTVGVTNVLVLGDDGSVTSELRVQVTGNAPGTVTVHRGLQSSTYACNALPCRQSGGSGSANPQIFD